LRFRRAALAASLVFLVASPWILRGLGAFLVREDTPRAADVVVVLAGDMFGDRMRKGCELLRQGLAPRALVSGPPALYGVHEDKFAVEWAGTQGCPVERLEGVPHNARSTVEEAEVFARLLRARGYQSYLMVTSDFHTRRAGRIFRRAIPEIPAAVVAAPYRYYRPEAWWSERESAKTFFFEWVKTVTSWFGL
jgi:uncharacterized SAM-binding protein YcdF (DUF218 family)